MIPASGLGASAQDATARNVLLIGLHPALAFAGVWSVVFALWALLPGETFARITGSERYVSTSALAFFGLSLLLFYAGLLIGPRLLERSRSSRPPLAASSEQLRLLQAGMIGALAVACLANGIVLLQGVIRAGGPLSLASQVLAGVPWSYLAGEYFIPSRVQGLTIWVQLNLAVAPLAVLGLLIALDARRSAASFKLGLIAGFLNALIVAFALSDRLAVYEFVGAAGVAWLGYSMTNPARRIGIGQLAKIAAVLGIITGVWFASEYGRTYLARFGPSLSLEQRAQIALTTPPGPETMAIEQFAAYAISGVNNGMYAVDHFSNHTLVYRSGKGIFTTLQLDREDSPLFGPGIREAEDLLPQLYFRDAYTVYSLPGYAFMDLSWGGGLVLLWWGLVVGFVYTRFRGGELWARLLYPLLFVGLLDSFRIFYWTESRMLVPAVFLTCLALAHYRSVWREQDKAGLVATRATAV
jgi:hypothetical protein